MLSIYCKSYFETLSSSILSTSSYDNFYSKSIYISAIVLETSDTFAFIEKFVCISMIDALLYIYLSSSVMAFPWDFTVSQTALNVNLTIS